MKGLELVFSDFLIFVYYSMINSYLNTPKIRISRMSLKTSKKTWFFLRCRQKNDSNTCFGHRTMVLNSFPRNRIEFCIFLEKQIFFKHFEIFPGIFLAHTHENLLSPLQKPSPRSSPAGIVSQFFSRKIIEIRTFCFHQLTRINLNYHFC